jgi:hypothetical protein
MNLGKAGHFLAGRSMLQSGELTFHPLAPRKHRIPLVIMTPTDEKNGWSVTSVLAGMSVAHGAEAHRAATDRLLPRTAPRARGADRPPR